MIVETYMLTADNTDILKAPSRLAAIPENGTLVIEAAADVCDATNNGRITMRAADGEVPLENCHGPACGTKGMIDGNNEWVITTPVRQGNHVQLELDVTGTVQVTLRITLQ